MHRFVNVSTEFKIYLFLLNTTHEQINKQNIWTSREYILFIVYDCLPTIGSFSISRLNNPGSEEFT